MQNILTLLQEWIINNQELFTTILVSLIGGLITWLFKIKIPDNKLKIVITQIIETIEAINDEDRKKEPEAVLKKLQKRANKIPVAKKALNIIEKSKHENLKIVEHIVDLEDSAKKFNKTIDTAKTMYKFGKGLFKNVIKLF